MNLIKKTIFDECTPIQIAKNPLQTNISLILKHTSMIVMIPICVAIFAYKSLYLEFK